MGGLERDDARQVAMLRNGCVVAEVSKAVSMREKNFEEHVFLKPKESSQVKTMRTKSEIKCI